MQNEQQPQVHTINVSLMGPLPQVVRVYAASEAEAEAMARDHLVMLLREMLRLTHEAKAQLRIIKTDDLEIETGA